MKKLVLVVVISLALPAAALGKGPSAAEISGPGLKTISLSGDGEDGGASTFGRFTEAAGFFPAMFHQQPDPMLRSRPKGDLGPRFTITWVVPGPGGHSRVAQDVYPYAKPYTVTHMRPGQRFWGTERTHGGWYVAGGTLKQALVSAGLSARPSSGGGSGLSASALAGIAAAAAAALALALLVAARIRRRPRPAVA